MLQKKLKKSQFRESWGSDARHHSWSCQRTTCQHQFSSSSMWTSRNQTTAIKLGSDCLYPLCHLTCQVFSFLTSLLFHNSCPPFFQATLTCYVFKTCNRFPYSSPELTGVQNTSLHIVYNDCG